MVDKTFSIEGMTCASCAQTVEKATGKLPGMKKSVVNLATEKLSVEYDESVLNEEDVQQAVADAGYTAVSNLVKKTFNVEGMTCASCAQTIEKATRKLPGMQEATVNLATEKLTVNYDPTALNLSDITKAVSDAGYEAHEEIDSSEQVDLDQEKKDKHMKNLWTRFLSSMIFTVPLFYISMGTMVGLPVPAFMDPNLNPLAFAITQIILTLPVMIINMEYF